MRIRMFPVVLLLFMVSFSVWIAMTPGQDFSYAENRPLARIPRPTLSSWKDTSFQTTLESALSDQWPGSEFLKTVHASIGRLGLGYTGGLMGLAIPPTDPRLLQNQKIAEFVTPVGGGVFSLLPTGIRFPSPFSFFGAKMAAKTPAAPMVVADPDPAASLETIQSSATLIGSLKTVVPDIPFHTFYLETSIDMDFLGGAATHAYEKTFSAVLPETIHHTSIPLSSTDQLRARFYRTDHHWNASGQQQGYATLVRFLKGETEPLVESSVLTLPNVLFSGSRARSANDFFRREPFDLLTFPLPKHEVFLDGAKGTYGNRDLYESGQASSEPGFNHYGYCNGQDYAEVRYAFPENEGRGHLLVLSDSYSNPLKPLIASHFETTRFIDLRFYESTFKEPFVLEKYVLEHEIDQVLLMGSHSFYRQLPGWLTGAVIPSVSNQEDRARARVDNAVGQKDPAGGRTEGE